MFEYIKRISIAVSFISNKVSGEENKIKNILENLSLDLLDLSQSFREDKYTNDDLKKLTDKILYLVDIIDFARINSYISPMNAQVFVSSQISFIKHLQNLYQQKSSISIPLFHLSQMDEFMARKAAKENMSTHSDLSAHNKFFDFNFTQIPQTSTNVSGNKVFISEKETETINQFNSQPAKVFEPIKNEPEVIQKKVVEESILYPKVSEEASPEHVEREITERRTRILKVLTTGGGSIREISSKLRDINEKTLQRDLLELMRDKKIIMLGKKRWAKYYLK